MIYVYIKGNIYYLVSRPLNLKHLTYLQSVLKKSTHTMSDTQDCSVAVRTIRNLKWKQFFFSFYNSNSVGMIGAESGAATVAKPGASTSN